MSTAVAAQRMDALAEANRIRLASAEHRRQLRRLSFVDGLNRAAEMLEDPDEGVARMQVGHLLRSIHRVGRKKVPRLLRQADLNPAALNRRVGPGEIRHAQPQLTQRQRLLLADVLRQLAEAPR